MKIDVVIGANFGDEGKGQTVHNLSSPRTTVVRFNGGAQAGHTVTDLASFYTVFHQIGAGTQAGAATHLASKVIINPMILNDELQAFPMVHVSASPQCRITTISDVITNMMVEQHRTARHGSCGVGIFETICRTAHNPAHALALSNVTDWADIVHNIHTVYIPERFAQLGIEYKLSEYYDIVTPAVIDNYIKLAIDIRSKLAVMDSSEALSNCDHLVFEGAQGLALSERKLELMPHLTPSDPGISNVVDVISTLDVDIASVNVQYITRPYLTRHGSGPLQHEWGIVPPYNVSDGTNIPNEWQGTIRYAPLDVDQLVQYIKQDCDISQNIHNIQNSVLITCCNQVPPNSIAVVENGIVHNVSLSQLQHTIGTALNMPTNTRF